MRMALARIINQRFLRLVFAASLCWVTFCNCGAPSATSEIHSTPPIDSKPLPPALNPPQLQDFNNSELGKRILQDHFDYLRTKNQGLPGYTINDFWIAVISYG